MFESGMCFSQNKSSCFPFQISHATANPSNELVSFDGLTGKYFRPSTVEAALDLLRDNPRLKVAGGCTELYILDQTPGHCEQFLLLTGIPELQAVERHNEPGAGHVRLGAALTINQVMEILNEEIKSSPGTTFVVTNL